MLILSYVVDNLSNITEIVIQKITIEKFENHTSKKNNVYFKLLIDSASTGFLFTNLLNKITNLCLISKNILGLIRVSVLLLITVFQNKLEHLLNFFRTVVIDQNGKTEDSHTERSSSELLLPVKTNLKKKTVICWKILSYQHKITYHFQTIIYTLHIRRSFSTCWSKVYRIPKQFNKEKCKMIITATFILLSELICKSIFTWSIVYQWDQTLSLTAWGYFVTS